MKKIFYFLLVILLFASCKNSETIDGGLVDVTFSLTSRSNDSTIPLEEIRYVSAPNNGGGAYSNEGVPLGITSLTIINKSPNHEDREATFNFYDLEDTPGINPLKMERLFLGDNTFEAYAYQNKNKEEIWNRIPFNTTLNRENVIASVKTISLYQEYVGRMGTEEAPVEKYVFTHQQHDVALYMLNQTALAALKFNITNIPDGYTFIVKCKDTSSSWSQPIDNNTLYVLNTKEFKSGGKVPELEIQLLKNNQYIRSAFTTIHSGGELLQSIDANTIYCSKISVNCDNDITSSGEFTVDWETNFIVTDWTIIDINWKLYAYDN